jgi:hypothetical protein
MVLMRRNDWHGTPTQESQKNLRFIKIFGFEATSLMSPLSVTMTKVATAGPGGRRPPPEVGGAKRP